MDLAREKKLREDFLVTLWEMHAGNYGGDVSTKQLAERIGIDYDTEASRIGQFLRGEGLISWMSFDRVFLEPKGRPIAEDIVERRYAETELRVLRKIYDLIKQNTSEPVFLHQLESELGINSRDMTGFCKGLEQKDLIEWPADSYLHITRIGIEAIQSVNRPKQESRTGDTYHIGSIHGPTQVGSHNVQNVGINVTNNPEFDQAIGGLLQLLEAAGLQNDEAEELRDEVVKLNKLALSEPKPGLLEKAKARIDLAKVGFEGAKLLVQAAPHLHTIWEFLKAKFQ